LTGLARNDISRRMVISLKNNISWWFPSLWKDPTKIFLLRAIAVPCKPVKILNKYSKTTETEFLFSTLISSARKSRWSEVYSLMQKRSLSEHPISEKNQCDRPRELGNIPRNTFRFTSSKNFGLWSSCGWNSIWKPAKYAK